MAKTGMDAVIAKAGKRAPLFKRKLAAKLEDAATAKSAPKSDSAEKKAEKSPAPMKETEPKSLDAKIEALMARVEKLEAYCADKDDAADEDAD